MQEDSSFYPSSGKRRPYFQQRGNETYIILHLSACSTGYKLTRRGRGSQVPSGDWGKCHYDSWRWKHVKCSPPRLKHWTPPFIVSWRDSRSATTCRIEEGRWVWAPIVGIADGVAFVLVVDLDQVEDVWPLYLHLDRVESRGQDLGLQPIPEPVWWRCCPSRSCWNSDQYGKKCMVRARLAKLQLLLL
jgi:hypothetical protein